MDKKELISRLREFKKRIQSKYKVSEIILFGSRASNKWQEESDVDLIIIGSFKEKTNSKRAPPFYIEWRINLPVDFICYTPQEAKNLSKRVSIVREARENGIII